MLYLFTTRDTIRPYWSDSLSRATLEAHDIIVENVTMVDKKTISTQDMLIVFANDPKKMAFVESHIKRHTRNYYKIDNDDLYAVSSSRDVLLGRVDSVDELTARGEDLYIFYGKKFFRVIPHQRPDYTEH